MRKNLILVLLASSAILFSGCTTRLGNLTIASTNNINGLNTNVKSSDRTTGDSCIHYVLGMPFGSFQNRLQIATDNAIDNGHKKGINGDALINAKLEQSVWSLIIYGRDCITIDGDLIPVKESMSK